MNFHFGGAALCYSRSRIGQVGEWLKPTDCKSVTLCELRRFESFPVHQSRPAFLIGRGQTRRAVVAQLVEHFLGKEEVSGSIPDNGSITPQIYAVAIVWAKIDP